MLGLRLTAISDYDKHGDTDDGYQEICSAYSQDIIFPLKIITFINTVQFPLSQDY